MPIQLTKSGTIFSENEKDLEQLRTEFTDEQYIKLKDFLSPEILKFVQDKVEKAEYYTLDHGDAGLDMRMKNNSTSELLHILVNDKKLLRLIEKITGCNPVKYFTGRVYKVIPGQGHYDTWHTDISWRRVLTLSINLSKDIYSGGILQIRDKKTKQIIQEILNTKPGDAILFPISTHMEHMLTTVEGNVPKIAFAGWYNSDILFDSFLKTKTIKLNKDTSEMHFTVSKCSTVVASKSSLFENLNSQSFIFDPVIETLYSLDTLGSFIWRLIQKPRTVAEVQDLILKNFDVDPRQCEQDLLSFLESLANAELILIGGKELESYTPFSVLELEKELVNSL